MINHYLNKTAVELGLGAVGEGNMLFVVKVVHLVIVHIKQCSKGWKCTCIHSC